MSLFSGKGNKVVILLLTMVLAMPLLTATKTEAAGTVLTIDSHTDQQTVPAGMTRISGSYQGAYAMQLVINGARVEDAHMDDPDGDDAGSWYYDLDLSKYDGEVELIARGVDASTRYNAWSGIVRLNVNNPAANVPKVMITSPADKAAVEGKVDVTVAVYAINPLKSVEIRINGGPWKQAKQQENEYVYKWNTNGIGNKTSSIEARAIDQRGNIGRSLTTYVKVGLGSEEPTVFVKQDRAMWIWEHASYNLMLNDGSRDVLDAMAADTATFNQQPVKTLYLGVDKYDGQDMLEDLRKQVRGFVSWAHRKGYRVEALIAGGTNPPYFGSYERYREAAVREFEKVLNYNISSSSEERFDGINLDTEPYSLPDFHAAYPSVQLQYLDMLAALMERKQASGLGLAVGPAIPRWYDSSDSAKAITWNGSTKWLSEHIQDTVDYIAIMDYRDQAEGSVGIIAQAQGEIDYANAIGKPNSVVIGVETKDIADGGDPATITFHEEGRTYMEAELQKVYHAFEDNPAFAGIALHHYDTVRTLPSRWGPGGLTWSPPADHKAPGKVSKEPVATTFSHERIDVTYGRAYDNAEVAEYRIYRGTSPEFAATDATLAGVARGLTFKDTGLLPDTTYYYKVEAVDSSGNVGKLSKAAQARTASTTLKPMIVKSMTVTYEGGKGTVQLEVADLQSGAPVQAKVHGRFTHMAGKYVSMQTAAANGSASAVSEAVKASATGEIGFVPRRIMASGYYWASAYDQPHHASVVW
ncbi:Ig-like domain-containing protein [Paenibacillus sp. GCM10027626]|uniref:Ig-like domain-containing protein n=1 Tax=Paenibacillus sp. GCM10027626 TaxID=3273411 RepID=UPI0036377CBA